MRPNLVVCFSSYGTITTSVLSYTIGKENQKNHKKKRCTEVKVKSEHLHEIINRSTSIQSNEELYKSKYEAIKKIIDEDNL